MEVDASVIPRFGSPKEATRPAHNSLTRPRRIESFGSGAKRGDERGELVG